jgi:hypothetical protein
MEANFYYAGLPSCPVLVARTGTPWEAPTDPEAPRKLKELRPAYNHALKDVWGASLAPKIIALLDSKEVKFTSIDIVSIGYPEDTFYPVIVWIGVLPESLSGDDGFVVASKCRELLVEYDITDVEVEIRESNVWPRFC